MEKELARMYNKVGKNMQRISGVLLWASIYQPNFDQWYMLKVTGLMIALSTSNLLLQKGYKLSANIENVSLQNKVKIKKKTEIKD